MSDDRFSAEQKEIEAAAASKEPRLCGALTAGGRHACELGLGHAGNHRVTLSNGVKRYWWNIPQSEFDRVLKELEPEPVKKLPPSVTARPEKDK